MPDLVPLPSIQSHLLHIAAQPKLLRVVERQCLLQHGVWRQLVHGTVASLHPGPCMCL